jgi:hypothetical protein
MPLTYDMTKVRNFRELNESSIVENNKSHYLALALMAVGVPDITEDTWNDAFVRIELLQKVEGGFLFDGEGNPVYWTAQDIFRRIGYLTNATSVPWTKFIKNLRDGLRFEAARAIRNASHKCCEHEYESACACCMNECEASNNASQLAKS